MAKKKSDPTPSIVLSSGFLDLNARRESTLRRQILEADLATAQARASAATEANRRRSEGAHALARKREAFVTAWLASVSGYLNGTDKENARALLRAAERARLPLGPGGDPLDERTVEAILRRARECVEQEGE